jgi:SAM-dependent methyltransferase
MVDQLTDVARHWTELGRTRPMWAALTATHRSAGGDWDSAEFLRTGHQEVAAVLRQLSARDIPVTTGTALDFGCGPGRLSSGLAAAGFDRVVGVDVSPTMLATARELVPDERVEFLHNTGSDLASVPSDSVDLVYSCRVLQHLPQALAHGYVREFFRVAAPGAPVVFQLPTAPVPGLVGTALRLAPRPVLVRLRRGMEMVGTAPAAVTRIVAEAGGVTVSIEEDVSAGPRWQSQLYLTRVRS